MTASDFTTTILLDQTPEITFNAINNVRGWWSEDIEGSTDILNEEFTYRYKDVHLCKLKIVEFIPNHKVVWRVLDNYFSFTNDKNEWRDTKISFEISQIDRQTQLHFTHWGLVPHYECYEVCQAGWGNYINHSLHSLILKGKGAPNPKEGDGFNSRLVEKWKLRQRP